MSKEPSENIVERKFFSNEEENNSFNTEELIGEEKESAEEEIPEVYSSEDYDEELVTPMTPIPAKFWPNNVVEQKELEEDISKEKKDDKNNDKFRLVSISAEKMVERRRLKAQVDLESELVDEELEDVMKFSEEFDGLEEQYASLAQQHQESIEKMEEIQIQGATGKNIIDATKMMKERKGEGGVFYHQVIFWVVGLLAFVL